MLNVLTKLLVDIKRDRAYRKERINLICDEISCTPFSSINFTTTPKNVGGAEIHNLESFSIDIPDKGNLLVWEDQVIYPLAHFGVLKSCKAILESESFGGHEAARILAVAREAYAKGRVG